MSFHFEYAINRWSCRSYLPHIFLLSRTSGLFDAFVNLQPIEDNVRTTLSATVQVQENQFCIYDAVIGLFVAFKYDVVYGIIEQESCAIAKMTARCALYK